MIEKKYIGEPEEEKRGGNSIEEANSDADRDYAKGNEMNVHTIAWPRLYPTESVVSEVDDWLDVVTTDPTMCEIAVNFPRHDDAENDAEKD